jgi:hypothetical protein
VTKKVAPVVASAVADAVKQGAPADLANEAAARGLDHVAAKPKGSKKTRSRSAKAASPEA